LKNKPKINLAPLTYIEKVKIKLFYYLDYQRRIPFFESKLIYMKNILILLSFLVISNFGFAQTPPKTQQPMTKHGAPGVVEEKDCYMEWYHSFQKYGTEPITDGTHEVIIAICKNSVCQCLLGKVDVAGEQIVRYSLYIQQEDGTYDKPNRSLSPKYSNPEAGLETHIHNGMSPAFLTSQDETVYLMFYNSLSKVPKKPKQAPKPKDLNKN
jgi:hypothetical protein